MFSPPEIVSLPPLFFFELPSGVILCHVSVHLLRVTHEGLRLHSGAAVVSADLIDFLLMLLPQVFDRCLRKSHVVHRLPRMRPVVVNVTFSCRDRACFTPFSHTRTRWWYLSRRWHTWAPNHWAHNESPPLAACSLELPSPFSRYALPAMLPSLRQTAGRRGPAHH